MKISNEYKFTSNRAVYNKSRKHILEQRGKIRCAWCKYHKSENSTSEWYHPRLVIEYTHVPGKYFVLNGKLPNWKLVSTNRKQWGKKKLRFVEPKRHEVGPTITW